MCGICGFLDVKGHRSSETLTDDVMGMADTLQHRGPDDCGSWVDAKAGVALGFRRLSILDLSETGVGDRALPHLKKLPNLVRLNLWFTMVSSEGCSDLAEIQSLEWLNLDKTRVRDDGVAELGALACERGWSVAAFASADDLTATDARLVVVEDLHFATNAGRARFVELGQALHALLGERCDLTHEVAIRCGRDRVELADAVHELLDLLLGLHVQPVGLRFQALVFLPCLFEPLLVRAVLVDQAALVQRALDDDLHLFQIERLRDVVARPLADGLDRRVRVDRPRDHDRRDRRRGP